MNQRTPVEILELAGTPARAVLRVSGALHAGSATPLVQRCIEIQAEGRDVVLDLSGISFLGSGGIGTLLMLAEQFQEQGGVIRFAALSPPAREVVRLLNLDRFLGIHETVEDALAKLAA
jgi:anti-anti-sigma factor